jgi:hypothetical protein
MRGVGSVSKSDSAGNEQTQPLTPHFIPVNVTFSLSARKAHVIHI